MGKPVIPESINDERIVGPIYMSSAYGVDDSDTWYETDSLAWSQVTHARTSLDWREFVAPPFLQSGDYSDTGTVGESNCRVFLEEYGERKGVWELYGSHGSMGVLIAVETLADPANADMVETLKGLDDYPLLDDDHHSDLEWTRYQEYWDDKHGGAYDMRYALRKAFPYGTEDRWEALPTSVLFNAWRKIAEDVNGGEEYVYENLQPWCDFERAFNYAKRCGKSVRGYILEAIAESKES